MAADTRLREAIDLMAVAPRMERHEEYGPWVYFIRHGEYIKIGTSVNPYKRLHQLQRNRDTHKLIGPQPGEKELLAVVPGTVLQEREWHRRFKADRVAGEWFRISDELAKAIAGVIHEQVKAEAALAGATPGDPMYTAIAMRKMPVLDLLTDEEYRYEVDFGLDD